MTSEQQENVRRIVQAAHVLRESVKGVEVESFSADLMRRRSVTGRLMAMGAAARALPDEFKAHRSSIDWDELSAVYEILLRNPDQAHPEDVLRFARTIAPRIILALGDHAAPSSEED